MRRSETPLRAISGFVHLQQDRCVNPLQIALSTSFRFGEHQYLPVSGLEAAFECGLESALHLGVARALAKQIITAEVLDRCERNRIDPLLQRDHTGGGKLSDQMGERADEIVERLGRQRAIDPAVSSGELRGSPTRRTAKARPRSTQDSGLVTTCY